MEVQLRQATLADAPGIARVHWLSWQATYPGILPSAEIERHTLANRIANWHRMLLTPGLSTVIRVALCGDALIGFASGGAFRVEKVSCGAAAEPNPALTDRGEAAGNEDGHGDGELNALYLLPEWQGQGIGRRLFDACAHDLHAAGFGAMRCWVLHGNPALGFYERLGGVRVGSKTYAAEGAAVPEHCLRFTLPGAVWPARGLEALEDPATHRPLVHPSALRCLSD